MAITDEIFSGMKAHGGFGITNAAERCHAFASIAGTTERLPMQHVFKRRHGGRNNYVTTWHARAEFGRGALCKYPEIIRHNFGHGFGIKEMKARYKAAIAAAPLFAVLVLPFVMSIAVIADVLEVSHYLYFWSIPIHTEVSGVEPVYETGEPIEFTVAHYNFGYYQQYPQYEIFKKIALSR